MATLEKIRSKSVFLIVVIGVALLAFIIGDALTNSRNILGDNTTVAKVGGAKIDFTDYQRKREELNNRFEEMRRSNPQQAAMYDSQAIPQMALDQLIQEQMVLDAADKVGIQVTGNILRYYMIDQPMQTAELGNVMTMLQQTGVKVQDVKQAYEIIFNPQRNGLTASQAEPLQRAWLVAEEAAKKQIKQMIYGRALQGTIRANELDKKALYADQTTSMDVDYAFLPFGKLDEKKYPVTDQEIQDRYNKEKSRFLVEEPTRDISFIAVDVAPSANDVQVSKDLAAATLNDMRSNEKLSKDLKNKGVSVSRHTALMSSLPAVMKDSLNAMQDGGVRIMSNNQNGFSIVKLISTKSEIDSICLNIVYAPTQELGKKILGELNAGQPLDSITKQYSNQGMQVQSKQGIHLFNAQGRTNALSESQLDSLRNSGGRYIKLEDGAQGTVLAQLEGQGSPVEVVEFDEATYTLAPSNKTKNDARTKLEKFLSANNSAKKFNANAAKSGYQVQKYTITASTPAIPRFPGAQQYFPDSRQVVRWIMMDGKTDEVSHIYDSNDPTHPMMYAVAIDDAYDEYIPVTNKQVRELLTKEIRAEKAGKALMAQYGNNAKQGVANAAAAMNVEVKTVDKFRFGPGTGIADYNVVGQIAGSKVGNSVITSGLEGVYVYQVKGVNKEGEYNKEISKQFDQPYMQFININPVRMLQGTKKLKNNIYKFEAGD